MPYYGQGVPTAIPVASSQPMYPVEQPQPQAHQQQFYAPQPVAFNDQTQAYVTSPPPHYGPAQL